MHSLDYLKDQPSNKRHDVSLQNLLQLNPDRQWTDRQINCRKVEAKTGTRFICWTTNSDKMKRIGSSGNISGGYYCGGGRRGGRKQKLIL